MYAFFLILHVIVSVILIVVILIQTGKGAGIGGIFGGGNDALFSAPSGSAFMKKLTIGLALGFACTTIILTVLHSRRTTSSVFQRVGPVQQQ